MKYYQNGFRVFVQSLLVADSNKSMLKKSVIETI